MRVGSGFFIALALTGLLPFQHLAKDETVGLEIDFMPHPRFYVKHAPFPIRLIYREKAILFRFGQQLPALAVIERVCFSEMVLLLTLA